MVDIPPHNPIPQNIGIINALPNPTYAQIKDNVLIVAYFCETKEDLQAFFDKLNERAIIQIAKALNQNNPERIQSGNMARGYIQHRFRHDSLETLQKRLNEEVIIEATQTGEMGVMSARNPTIDEPLKERLGKWFKNLFGKNSSESSSKDTSPK